MYTSLRMSPSRRSKDLPTHKERATESLKASPFSVTRRQPGVMPVVSCAPGR